MGKQFVWMRGKRIWLDFGWYADEIFKLFSITVCEARYDPVLPVCVTLFDLQIIKFCVSFGFCT